MRIIPIVAALVMSASSGAAVAKQNPPLGPSTHDGMGNHPISNHTGMMRPSHNNTGLGSMRHPTVGNTANQRTNGG